MLKTINFNKKKTNFMKNIHVLPTENYKQDYTTQRGEVIKVVRLGQLILNKETNQLLVNKNTQWAASCDTDVLVPHHMYITSSDKEVTKDEWWIDTKDNLVFKVTDEDILVIKEDGLPQGFFKIILTTDQDLIADGVQPIGDKLLEWFIKNTGCETVEIDRDEREVGNHLGGVVTEYGDYKIIITEEEINMFTKGKKYIQQDGVVILAGENGTNGIVITDHKKMWGVGHYSDEWNPKAFKLLEEPKQETLEEPKQEQTAIEWLIETNFGSIENCTPDFRNKIEQAKEMEKQQQGFSEEDLEVAFFEGQFGKYSFNDWFEQFKNK